ncbi:MAG TPA: xanthine dehydrogenase family protein subunit M [Acidobacteriota bacterium]|nr:xanthine dehydrogenase family protein subunit M [Acidobacteriota bacterium]
MIRNFTYVKAGSISEAIKALAAKGVKLHAGGTDLMGCMRDEVFQVQKVVSISGLKNLKGTSARPDGGMKIGALTTVADVASSVSLAEKYAVLSQAAAEVASPQLREQGTIGGNLCQRPRCWYFRGDFQCARKGGDMCYAVDGENQYHAIFGGGPCFFVHPSDIAVALVALQAQIVITGPAGSKAVRIESFFVSPDKNVEKENILAQDEIVTEIHLPPLGGKVLSSYRKIRARRAWDFALTSVGVVLQFENEKISKARIVLGGVAPYPWRATAAEKLLIGRKPDAELAAAAGQAAADGANPMRDNAYKVEMVKGAVEESVLALRA